MIKTQIGTQNISEDGHRCVGHFVRYHPVTVTSNRYSAPWAWSQSNWSM